VKVELESTDQLVVVSGVSCRVWQGKTAKGVPVHAFVALIRVRDDQDVSEFEAELTEQRKPTIGPALLLLL
jgi:hypothetical protein